MESFSFPERPTAEITGILNQTGIAASLRPDDLLRPSADLVCSIYSNFIAFVDPLGDAPDGQIGFEALELIDNPDHHVDSIRVLNLYRKIKEMLSSIRYNNFTLRDLLKPDGKRTVHILSTVVNFLYYREDKLNMLQPIADQLPGYEERKIELEAKISELTKEMMDHEVARQLEEPIVLEVNAEVNKLKLAIQNYNRQQMSLKTTARGLKENTDAIIEKISQADFELMKNAQENQKLRSKVVQSPDKLQRALEDKKAVQTEVKNSEKLAMQTVQKKTATLELHSKVYEKMSKHFSQMQTIQEQVTSVKGVDKDIKALRPQLSEQEVLSVSLDAKLEELRGKEKQVAEMIKLTEKERDIRHEQDSKRLESLRTEIEWQLHCLEPREKAVEAVVVKGKTLCSDADAVREAGNVSQRELLGRLQEIINAFYSYSNSFGEAEKSIEDSHAIVQLVDDQA